MSGTLADLAPLYRPRFDEARAALELADFLNEWRRTGNRHDDIVDALGLIG